ncbi:MAG TPA: class I SAM-dependent methyltransferase [Candidatus Solibacter sp.]|nr:class I SAM-dependent methyltransferase [Candidatus Solibacter sp.]
MHAIPSPYDTAPYPNLAFSQTHPDRLAVLATLFGMNPPALERCRVLELACGDGSNLLPMAYGLPGSEFVGVDLATKPVALAQRRIRRIGLINIRIEAMDLMEIGPRFGKFDYIIAHGVYAWVPEAVQAKILAICSANLSANGVAFVSYNTNPAGHVRRILREMVQFHESRVGHLENRVKSSREFLEAILDATDAGSPWKLLFQEELKSNFGRDEKVVFHDDLTECFRPASFGDFAERAAKCGLQYLCEAPLSEVMGLELGEAAHVVLKNLAGGDAIAHQQYLDFARYRRFRQSLLCHANLQLRHDGLLDYLGKLLVASPMTTSAKGDDGEMQFTNSRGLGTLETNNPLIIAALRRLEEIWPRGESFDALTAVILQSVPAAQRVEVLASLKQAVLQLAPNGLADLRTCNPPFANGVTEKPKASALARMMVEECGVATTLLHTHVNFEDDAGRKFLHMLDGTQDWYGLANALAGDFPNESPESILNHVKEHLVKFHRLGLLVA